MSQNEYHFPNSDYSRLPERRFGARAAIGIAGVALTAVGLVMSRFMHGEVPAAASAPNELHIEGEIDMDTVHLSPDSIKSTKLDAIGVKVVEVGEYVPAIGQAVYGQAEFVNVNTSPFPQTELSKKIDRIIEANAPILNALAWERKIGAVRFNMAIDPNEEKLQDTPAGDMRFLAAGTEGAMPLAAVIEYTLPSKGRVSMDTIAGMVSHEATHIRQRELSIVDMFNSEEKRLRTVPVDANADRDDISELRAATIGTAERDSGVIAAAREVMTVTTNSKTRVALEQRKVAQSILEGTFNELQPTDKSPSMVADFAVDEGRIDRPSYVVAKAGLTPEQYAESTPAQTTAELDLENAFERALKSPDSPLSLFDESSYGHAEEVYGHPESNTSELICGAENALLSYPRQLLAKLERLPESVQKTALRFIKRVNADTQRANETGYAHRKTQALHNLLNHNVEWLEKELNGS